MPDRSALDRDVLLLWSLSLILGGLIISFPATFPFTPLMIPLLLANNWLSPRQIPPLVALVLLFIAVDLWRLEPVTTRNVVAAVVFFVIGLVMLLSARRRHKWGVGKAQGESMLAELQARIQASAPVPDLPSGWKLDAAVKSAGVASFSGDFYAAARLGQILQLVVVDVSGKGVAAGTRSMLMNGAVGGLLGAVPPDRFMEAANDYLLRQGWDEGFATAIHLVVDLSTGAFQLRSAGHPPAAQMRAGSGRWTLHSAEGPILGLIENQTFQPVEGRLSSGDRIMLFTDGMVESARRELGLGIDQLLGRAERVMHSRPADLAETLLREVGVPDDDKALILLTRS